MIAWLLISFAVLMLFGVPIGISLGLSAMGGILLLDGGSGATVSCGVSGTTEAIGAVSGAFSDELPSNGTKLSARW